MKTSSSSISASKHYVRCLLKPSHKSLRYLSVASRPPGSQKVKKLFTQINTTDDWTADAELTQRILSLPRASLPNIACQLKTSTKALQFFHFIRHNPSPSQSPPPLDSIFKIVVELAMREKNHESILGLFNLSRELKLSLKHASKFSFLDYFSRVKNIQNAVLVYDDIDPDDRSRTVKNILLEGLIKSGRFDDARQLLDEMLQPDAKFPPNERTFNSVFPILSRSHLENRTDYFIGLIRKFRKHGVFRDTVWLTQLITKLCRSYRDDIAWDLLHELMKFEKVEAAPCEALLCGLAKERNYKKINVLLQEMRENEIKPDTATNEMVVNHLCNLLKNMKAGNDWFSMKPDVIIYNNLIDVLCKVGRQEEGVALIKQMRSEDNCVPDVITYNCLIGGFCKSGEIERSLELLEQMKNEGVDPNVVTVNTLVHGMCKHGRISNAMEFFREMQEEKGIKVNAATYFTLISAFCNVNNIEKAMTLFDEMESTGSADALAYNSLYFGLILVGRPDDADLIASKMKKAGFKLDLGAYKTLLGDFVYKEKP